MTRKFSAALLLVLLGACATPPANLGELKTQLTAYHTSGAYDRALAAVDAEAEAFLRANAAKTARPALVLDVGALMGSLVGQTEQRVREALRTIDAMAPCVAFIDEVEKALGGAASGGQGDSGGGTHADDSFRR